MRLLSNPRRARHNLIFQKRHYFVHMTSTDIAHFKKFQEQLFDVIRCFPALGKFFGKKKGNHKSCPYRKVSFDCTHILGLMQL